MADGTRLGLVWSSADRMVARSMVFMYAKNSRLKGWWDQVRLVVWGPSARLLAMDRELQDELEDLKTAGVEIQACKACADMQGVSRELEALGVEVKYMGQPLTEMLQGGWKVLTF
ncbi:MAG: DsrE family protein [Pseudomonadota bacterium]